MGILFDFRDSITDAIAASPDLDINTYNYLPGSANTPCAIVLAGSPYLESGQSFGEHHVRFEVWIVARTGDNGSETRQLDELAEAVIFALADDWVVENISQPFSGGNGTDSPALTIALTVVTSTDLFTT